MEEDMASESLAEVRKSLGEKNEALQKARADARAAREEYEEKQRLLDKEKKSAKDIVRQERQQIQRLVKGPDSYQMGADVGALVVGEGIFRLITWGMHKLGLQNPIWYTVPTGALGSLLYVITYPRREEGPIRKLLRAMGLYWSQVSLHDGVGYLVQGSQTKADQFAQLAAQNKQLQDQLAQVAGQGQQQPARQGG
jgi:hypothetical protein